MKKISVFLMSALALVMTSCGGGFDKAKVDKINIDNPSVDDYKVMVEQAKYGLDDIEKAGDVTKFEKENPEEAEAVVGLCFALAVCQDADPDFPKDLKDEVKEITKRFDKVVDKAASTMPDVDGPVDIDDVDVEVEAMEY